MEEYTFEDALAHSVVKCAFPGLETSSEPLDAPTSSCTSLFFPGCSNINYSLPLVNAVYDLLKGAGRVDGISLLCCGKILQYEQNADTVRPAFEQSFRDHLATTDVQRIIVACPNCMETLREMLAAEERTANVKVVPLTDELVDLGYRVDPDVAQRVAHQDPRIAEGERAVFCVKDSCPDRKTGEIAEGLRTLMPAADIVDPAHNRRRSMCCGSRQRAAGRMDAALKSCTLNHEEARAAGANALVAPCMSCAFLLSNLHPDLPVFHYLELLFDYRVPWEYADQYMKLRFLFEDLESPRDFQGIA